MSNDRIHINMGFTDEKFLNGTHMCLIYSNEEERKDIISKYINSGISSKEKVAYFADELSPTEIKQWLSEKGVEFNNEDLNNFVVTDAKSVYCPHGHFHPDEMLETLKNFYITSASENFLASRVTGEMAWALKGIPGSKRLMEYESKVNDLVADYPVTAICQYDANQFDGYTILECLKVHPFMIIKDQIIRNPYYLKPSEYLQ